MFRCKECGAEYDIKPDYCDCGNDEFEEVVVKPELKLEPEQKQEIAENVKIVQQDSNVQNTTTEKPKPAQSNKFNNTVQKPIKLNSFEPISLTIFLICIILSLYVVFFAWNPKDTDTITEEKQEVSVSKNIPSIEKLWNNALPVVKTEPAKSKEVKPSNQVKQINPVKAASPQKQTIPAKMAPSKSKNTSSQVKNTIQAPKITQTNKQTSTVKQQTNINAQEQAKKAAEEAAKRKAEQERLEAEAAQLKKLQAEQAKKAAEEKAKKQAAAKQELANYKASLRNTIGKKIDFTRVIGDGTCTIAFRIDSNGKLINRSFAKQSTNNTLNDEVYKAIIATPVFNPPPSAYNNEILNLYIRFSNGNFEISLP